MGVKVVSGLVGKGKPETQVNQAQQAARSGGKSNGTSAALGGALAQSDAAVTSVRTSSAQTSSARIRDVEEARKTADSVAQKVLDKEEDSDVHTHLGATSAPREHFS